MGVVIGGALNYERIFVKSKNGFFQLHGSIGLGISSYKDENSYLLSPVNIIRITNTLNFISNNKIELGIGFLNFFGEDRLIALQPKFGYRYQTGNKGILFGVNLTPIIYSFPQGYSFGSFQMWWFGLDLGYCF